MIERDSGREGLHWSSALTSFPLVGAVVVVAVHVLVQLYISHGASRDDLRALFAHSSLKVTERYLHGKDTNLAKVSNIIQLFPVGTDPKSTQIKSCG